MLCQSRFKIRILSVLTTSISHYISHCMSHCISHCIPHSISHYISHCISTMHFSIEFQQCIPSRISIMYCKQQDTCWCHNALIYYVCKQSYMLRVPHRIFKTTCKEEKCVCNHLCDFACCTTLYTVYKFTSQFFINVSHSACKRRKRCMSPPLCIHVVIVIVQYTQFTLFYF